MRLSELRLRQSHPWRTILREVRKRAKKKGLACDLTNGWASERWTGRCEISGLKFVSSDTGKFSIFTASIDRLDADLGYTQGNCRFVLLAVNMLKGIGTDDEMFEIAQAIVNKRARR